jgi:hypothetical protein
MASEAQFTAPSSYQHYEDTFKESEIPIRHRRNIARVLLAHGVPASEVAMLGLLTNEDGDDNPAVMSELREIRATLDAILSEMRRPKQDG